jgi:transcriptional regulator with XRE-family HTH domain
MSRDLDAFLAEVHEESNAAGPAAVAEFEAYLRHFELSRQIFELRKAHGWSQLELARQSGVQQSEISRIEHGQGNPTYQTLTAIAGAMQMRLTFVPSRRTGAKGGKRVAPATTVRATRTRGGISRRLPPNAEKARHAAVTSRSASRR